MKKSQSPSSQSESPAEKQDIEQLRRRYSSLHEQKIRVEEKKNESERKLAELKEQARKQYGTDDPEELKRKLTKMQEENERLRSEYQDHLDGIERKLDEVESQHKATGGDGNEP